jgi:hypothetical protein
MRYLTWHLPEGYQQGAEVGAVYRMDGSYRYVATWLYSKGAPQLVQTIVDINRNGTSIFEDEVNRPRLVFEQSTYRQFVEAEHFEEGDTISLDVDQKGDGSGPLTVTVELDEA